MGRPFIDMKNSPFTHAIMEYMEHRIEKANNSPVECRISDIIAHLSSLGITTNVASVSRYITWITSNTHVKFRRKYENSIDPTKEYWIDREVE